MKTLLLSAALLMAATLPGLAEEAMTTTTPELALPEPDQAPLVLPHSSVTDVQPLSLPEPETEAIAPYKGCGDRETVYLTN